MSDKEDVVHFQTGLINTIGETYVQTVLYTDDHCTLTVLPQGVVWHTGIGSRLWCGRSRVQSPAGPLVEDLKTYRPVHSTFNWYKVLIKY